jgi:L-2-hydroxyglutarate oxidase LhgO
MKLLKFLKGLNAVSTGWTSAIPIGRWIAQTVLNEIK